MGRGAGRRESLRLLVPCRPRRSPHAASAALHICQTDKNITEKCFQIVIHSTDVRDIKFAVEC